MPEKICRYCGSNQLKAKEIEIRRINAISMTLASTQWVTELECQHCGWTVAAEADPVPDLSFALAH